MDFEDEFKAGHLFLENRKCRICGIEKSLLADFYKCRKDPNLRSSYSYECKDCAISRVKANYARDPSKSRNNDLKRLYGITLDDYNEMLTEQKNSCLFVALRIQVESMVNLWWITLTRQIGQRFIV